MVQTVAGEYLLTIEIYAYPTEGLQQMAASLQTMTFSDEECSRLAGGPGGQMKICSGEVVRAVGL